MRGRSTAYRDILSLQLCTCTSGSAAHNFGRGKKATLGTRRGKSLAALEGLWPGMQAPFLMFCVVVQTSILLTVMGEVYVLLRGGAIVNRIYGTH